MTTGAKWVLGVLAFAALGLAALAAGLAGGGVAEHAPQGWQGSVAWHALEAARRGPQTPDRADAHAGAPVGTGGVLAAATSQMGHRYVTGGSGPSGFDCSGFTSWSFARAGVALPRTSGGQFQAGRAVAASALRPGDLVFFSSGGGVDHVGIYLDGGRFIHSARGSGGVGVDSLNAPYWASTFAGGRRVW